MFRQKKYVDDYVVVEEVTESGRIKRYGEYAGPLFKVQLPREEFRGLAKKLLLMCIAGWIFFMASLSVVSLCTTRMYFLFPYCILVIPLGGMLGCIFYMFRYYEDIIRSDADIMRNRYPTMCLLGLVLSGASLIAFIVSSVSYFKLLCWGDALAAVSCIYNLLYHIYAFRQRAKIAPKQISG